jgi:hypothetical protein
MTRFFLNLPAEIKVISAFTAFWLLLLSFGLPLNIPGKNDLYFIQVHYFGPIMLAAVLQIVATGVTVIFKTRSYEGDPYLMLKLIPVLVVATFLHFNFKSWMPLVNPYLFDNEYQQIDRSLSFIVDLFVGTRQFISSYSPTNLDHTYHLFFVGMFFYSINVHALVDTKAGQRRLVLGTALILMLGGVCYWIAPAVGPFIFRDGVNALSQASQARMYEMFLQLKQTGVLPAGYFCAPPAAMPSLHIANSLFFILAALGSRKTRWLLFFYIPLFCWIVIESVSTAFHYVIDLPFGVLLALLCMALSRKLVKEKVEVTESDSSEEAFPAITSPSEA